jgi:hypothetical protein
MRIFVAGLARSGTTWFAKAVSSAPGVQYIHEPDTRSNDVFAHVGTRGIDFHEPIPPGMPLPNYELMWDLAFAGGWPPGRLPDLAKRLAAVTALPRWSRSALLTAAARRAKDRRPPTEHQLVKSVRIVMTLEWIAARYRPKTIVVWRSPLNMLASYRERDQRGGEVQAAVGRRFEGTAAWPPPPDDDGSMVWNLCSRLGVLLETAARHPEWLVVRHERVAADPVAGFRDVLAWLDLPWSGEVETFLEEANRPGTGWAVERVATDEGAVWKRRLTPAQVRTAADVIARFSKVPGVEAPFEECLAELG